MFDEKEGRSIFSRATQLRLHSLHVKSSLMMFLQAKFILLDYKHENIALRVGSVQKLIYTSVNSPKGLEYICTASKYVPIT